MKGVGGEGGRMKTGAGGGGGGGGVDVSFFSGKGISTGTLTRKGSFTFTGTGTFTSTLSTTLKGTGTCTGNGWGTGTRWMQIRGGTQMGLSARKKRGQQDEQNDPHRERINLRCWGWFLWLLNMPMMAWAGWRMHRALQRRVRVAIWHFILSCWSEVAVDQAKVCSFYREMHSLSTIWVWATKCINNSLTQVHRVKRAVSITFTWVSDHSILPKLTVHRAHQTICVRHFIPVYTFTVVLKSDISLAEQDEADGRQDFHWTHWSRQRGER